MNRDPIQAARDILEVIEDAPAKLAPEAMADSVTLQRAESWALLSIAESLAILATPPPICGDKWLAGPERVVACIFPLGHLGDHRAADGTRLAS